MTESSRNQVFDQFVGDIETSLQLAVELEQMLQDMRQTSESTSTPYFDLGTSANLTPSYA